MLEEPTEAPRRAQRTHIFAHERSIVPAFHNPRGTLADLCARWLLPWERREYPGVLLGLAQIIMSVTPGTLKEVRKGKRRLQPYLAAELADLIESRCAAGLALVERLREVERVGGRTTPLGFREVKDWDGSGVMTDARGKRRRAKKV